MIARCGSRPFPISARRSPACRHCGRAPLTRGDYRVLALAPLAALVCGGLWEMWNWHSLAHWRYATAYVDRYHLFAMPALGYAGYLPFGLECLVIAELLPSAKPDDLTRT